MSTLLDKSKLPAILFSLLCLPALVFSQTPLPVRPIEDINLWGRAIADNYLAVEKKTVPVTGKNLITKHQLDLLKYYKALGYTHVLYYVSGFYDGDFFTFEKSSGWTYNDGGNGTDYTAGTGAASLRTTKEAYEHYGLKMLPMLFNTLSHMDREISQNPSLGEFQDPDAYTAYAASAHYGNSNWQNHVAYVGDYGSSPVKNNPSADQKFERCLQLLNANWADKAYGGATALGGAYPKYVHIGHDELGCGTGCMVAEGRAKGLLKKGTTKSDLIAREIAYRYKQIQKKLTLRGNRVVQVILHADSFLPGCFGEVYLNEVLPAGAAHRPAGSTMLCGNPSTGRGGILYKIRYDSTIASRIIPPPGTAPIYSNLIMMPWGYGNWFDGAHCGSGTPSAVNDFDVVVKKSRQLAYLSKLGYKYIPLTGENQDYGCLPDWVNSIKLCTFEWVKAVQTSSSPYCLGIGASSWTVRYQSPDGSSENPTYSSDNADSNSLKTGYQAALLAYAAWSYPKSIAKTVYHPDFFVKCRYQQARNTLTWIKGTDYSAY